MIINDDEFPFSDVQHVNVSLLSWDVQHVHASLLSCDAQQVSASFF